jgi:Tfp pilus assembly protein PilN
LIEVNLVPGATRRPSRRRAALKLPSFKGGFGKLDPYLAAAIAAWIVCPALVGFMFFSTQQKKAEVALDLEKARQDSVHYALTIKANERLRARRDSIADKLQLIQDIDANRYVWAHVLDEVARALPDHTWLMYINEVPDTVALLPHFEVNGRTGNTFALTEFMKDLEGSPFVHNVQLVTTTMVKDQGKEVHSFSLQADYEVPPADAIQTVPIFKPEE